MENSTTNPSIISIIINSTGLVSAVSTVSTVSAGCDSCVEMTTSALEQPARKGSFQILYFASAASYTKKQSETLPAPLPFSGLFPLLDSKYPGIWERVLGSCSVSIGLEYVDLFTSSEEGVDGVVIRDGDEVGIIPPVSSG